MRFYFPITRVTENDDGTMTLAGPATSEALCSDGYILDYEGSVSAFEDWFATGPNVREQHDSKRAIGTGLSMQPNPETRTIDVSVLISKTEKDKAQEKIREGVLRGFSVLGDLDMTNATREKVNGKTGTRVKNWTMSELSVVDRPADPVAYFTFERGAKAPEGEAMPKNTPPAAEPAEPKTPEPVKREEVAMCARCSTLGRALFCAKCAHAAGLADEKDANAERVAAVRAALAKRAEKAATLKRHYYPGGERDDVRQILDILDRIAWLCASECAEGETETPQIDLLNAMSDLGSRFLVLEAVELIQIETVEEPAAERAAAPAADVAALLAPLGEQLGQITATLARVEAAPKPEPAPIPTELTARLERAEKATEALPGITKKLDELSGAIGDLKGLPAEVKAVRASQAQILDMPRPGGPIARVTTQTQNSNVTDDERARIRIGAIRSAAAGAPDAVRDYLDHLARGLEAVK